MLCSSSVLKLLNFIKPFFLELDALSVAIGAVLLLQYDNGLYPVA